VNLWVPFEVASLDRSLAFWAETLGLSEVERWSSPEGERGVVLRVPGPGVVELVQPAPGAPGRGPAWPAVALALELPDAAAVDVLGLGTPTRFPRGHYGLTARDPGGIPILLWSER
jgi:catechol 2,3-dioxygenase-like lactoylglutathione lyase family enzyme